MICMRQKISYQHFHKKRGEGPSHEAADPVVWRINTARKVFCFLCHLCFDSDGVLDHAAREGATDSEALKHSSDRVTQTQSQQFLKETTQSENPCLCPACSGSDPGHCCVYLLISSNLIKPINLDQEDPETQGSGTHHFSLLLFSTQHEKWMHSELNFSWLKLWLSNSTKNNTFYYFNLLWQCLTEAFMTFAALKPSAIHLE